jgi:hypothetical protein
LYKKHNLLAIRHILRIVRQAVPIVTKIDEMFKKYTGADLDGTELKKKHIY